MKMLSLDPGSHKLGYALWEDDRLIEWGVWTASIKDDTWDRIGALLDRLDIYITTHAPDVTAIEDPQGYSDRAQRVLSLVVGAIYGLVSKELSWPWSHCEWYPYNQATIKAACVLRGTPTRLRNKAAVRQVIEQWHPEAEGADEDAIDAIAVGETHLARCREAQVIEREVD